MTDQLPESVTPTEDLVMELLAARYRLGEHLWTFDSRHKRAIERLASRGLVQPMHGIVERTIRASLTEAGRAAYLDADYQPPLVRSALQIVERVQHNVLYEINQAQTEADLSALLDLLEPRTWDELR